MARANGEIAPLTGVRGVAALWVVLHHMEALLGPDYLPWPSFAADGYLGVDLFFILSGFIIAHVYADGARPGQFLWRRMARVYPLHVAMIAVYGLFLMATDYGEHYPERFTGVGLASQLTLTQAWGHMPLDSWNVPSWSISAEWFVYLLFPVALLPLWRRLGVGGALAWSALAWAALAVVPILNPRGNLYSTFDFALLRVVPEFMIGMGLRRIWAAGAPGGQFDALALMGGVGFVAVLALGAPDLLAIPCLALLVLGLAGARGPVARVFASRPLHRLGLISYSIYLTHYLLLILFALASPRLPGPHMIWVCAYLAGLYVISEASYRGIERPARALLTRGLSRSRESWSDSARVGP